MTESTLSNDQEQFRDLLGKFCAETGLSRTSSAKLLDVNPGSINKWYKVDVATGKIRLPQQYVRDSITLKIKRLNAANQELGTYSELRGMKPGDRVTYLQSVLDSNQFS